MSELRHDPVQKRWVIIAAERENRPYDFGRVNGNGNSNGDPSKCPFCPGNEAQTPPEVLSIRPHSSGPNKPGWKLRVVPNLYPAFDTEGTVERKGLGVFDLIHGVGAHEVIIESPNHDAHLADMSVEDVAAVARAYRDRISHLHRDPRLRYVLIFKNHGQEAGASLHHPHSQLIATPITPRIVSFELDSAREHFQLKERCLFCDIVNQELALKDRIALQTEQYVVLCPFASRFPYEMWVLPRHHQHDFASLEEDELFGFAVALKTILWKLRATVGNIPFNYILHTAPNAALTRPGRPHYWDTLPYDWHWHLEIIPALKRHGGFEWGSGFYINTMSPETASRKLSEAPGPDEM